MNNVHSTNLPLLRTYYHKFTKTGNTNNWCPSSFTGSQYWFYPPLLVRSWKNKIICWLLILFYFTVNIAGCLRITVSITLNVMFALVMHNYHSEFCVWCINGYRKLYSSVMYILCIVGHTWWSDGGISCTPAFKANTY